jgi:hypothetical protein
MKKILLIVTVVAVAFAAVMGTMTLTANKSKSVINTDTIGLAQFQAWKAAQYDKMLMEANQPVKQTTAVRRTSTRSSSGSMNSVSSYPAKTTQKKGWSKAAKGTVIGAGTGAVLGAVINKKNRAAGAVIGGILGGGVGYGVGRHMDKKDGRY